MGKFHTFPARPRLKTQFLSAKPANQFRVDEAMLGEIHIHPWASTPICESPRGLLFFSDVVFYIVSLGH